MTRSFCRTFCTLSIVGLDSPRHLAENAAVASNFRRMKQARRDELSGRAKRALAGVPPPWDRPGYVDGRAVG